LSIALFPTPIRDRSRFLKEKGDFFLVLSIAFFLLLSEIGAGFYKNLEKGDFF